MSQEYQQMRPSTWSWIFLSFSKQKKSRSFQSGFWQYFELSNVIYPEQCLWKSLDILNLSLYIIVINFAYIVNNKTIGAILYIENKHE
mmetsp:Transcript_15974/g.19823  ORF Transcript_15974/g.19823 Transcript_15974/m.19823 type:complete len:88 (+) Transcript_15974:1264-1527(+)